MTRPERVAVAQAAIRFRPSSLAVKPSCFAMVERMSATDAPSIVPPTPRDPDRESGLHFS